MAIVNDAIGFTISGAGPAMLGLFKDEFGAKSFCESCQKTLQNDFELSSDYFFEPLNNSSNNIPKTTTALNI